MVKTKKKKQQKSDHMAIKLLVLLVIVFAVCFGGLTVWHYLKPKDKEKTDDKPVAEKVEETSSEEKKEEPSVPEGGATTEGDDIKEQAAKSENERQSVPVDENGLKVATISLDASYSNGVATAHGVITNLAEEGGTCNYVFKGPNNKEINNSMESVTDGHRTLCGTAEMTKAELGAGQWQVKLIYKSKNAKGESESKSFSVQ